MDIQTYGGMPGVGAITETTEVLVWSGRETDQIFGTLTIKSTTVDSGNTPTTALRPGLILAKKTSDGLLYAYNPDAIDGTEIAFAVLSAGISTLDASGTAADKLGHVMLGGILKAASLVTGQDGGLDSQARRQLLLSGRFFFDDDIPGKPAFLGLPLREVVKAADYTVLASDNGTLFTASAAANFTLPALAAGLCFEFLNLADSNMTVTSAAGDDIVWVNDAACDSLAASTANQKIGAHLQFFTNSAGTKWYVRNMSPSTITITAAT